MKQSLLIIIAMLSYIAANAQTDTLIIGKGSSSVALTGEIKGLDNEVFTIKLKGGRFKYNAEDVTHLYISNENVNKAIILNRYDIFLINRKLALEAPIMFKDATTGKIMLTDTVTIDSISLPDIYSRARAYLLATPHIQNKYVVSIDSISHQIILTGKNDLNQKTNINVEKAHISYLVDFKCRAGKYRIVFIYNTFEAKTGALLYATDTSTNLENSLNYKKYGPGQRIPYINEAPIVKFAISIIKELKTSILTPAKEDW
jgi:hypothetical protein